MFENKLIDALLSLVPRNRWNLLSNILARMSVPTIGSPISFTSGKFTLKEFDIMKASGAQLWEYLDFCYPLDMSDRDREIEIDRQYWPGAATFIVVNGNGDIQACAQYLDKYHVARIPFECSHRKSESGAVENDGGVLDKTQTPRGNYAEIYRCRRSFNMEGHDAALVVLMLFKALWAKTVQESVQSIFITFDPCIRELKNLYTKKLRFHDSGITVRFGNNPKDWQLLVKDCLSQENEMAALSRHHFFMQTWFRKNLRKKNLRPHSEPPLVRPVTAHLVSEVPPVLFTEIAKPARSPARARRPIPDRVRTASGAVTPPQALVFPKIEALPPEPEAAVSGNSPNATSEPVSFTHLKIVRKRNRGIIHPRS
jgi:hypothetical protein